MRRYPDIVANFRQPMTAAEAARVSAERPAPAWTGNLERLAVQAAIARSRPTAMPAAQRARIDAELARAAALIAREKAGAAATMIGTPTLAEEVYAVRNRAARGGAR
jgi:hypothetical protein